MRVAHVLCQAGAQARAWQGQTAPMVAMSLVNDEKSSDNVWPHAEGLSVNQPVPPATLLRMRNAYRPSAQSTWVGLKQ